MKHRLSGLFSWKQYFSRKERIGLTLLLVTGLALRVINAYAVPLWRDEIYIISTSGLNSFWNLFIQNHWDTAHPPLYFLFLHAWEKLGWSPFLLRIPSLVCALFILYLVPVLTILLYRKNRTLPFLSLFFFSFSHTQISLSMVARPYPFVLLGMFMSLILFVDMDRHEDKRVLSPRAAVFALVTFLTFMTDYAAVWLILGYWTYWLIRVLHRRGSGTLIGRGLLFASALCLTWTPFFLRGLQKALGLEQHLGQYFTGTNPFSANLWQLAFFTGASDYNAPFLYNEYVYQAWYVGLFVLSVIGLLMAGRTHRKNTVLGILLIVVPLAASFAISVFFKPIFQYRNLLVVNIFVLFGLSNFVFFLSRLHKIIIPVIVMLWIYVFLCAFPFLHFVDPPRDWNQIARIVAPKARRAIIITETPDKSRYDAVYYFAGYSNKKTLEVVWDYKIGTTKIPTDAVVYLSYISSKRKRSTGLTSGLAAIAKNLKCRSLYEYSVDNVYLARCDRTVFRH